MQYVKLFIVTPPFLPREAMFLCNWHFGSYGNYVEIFKNIKSHPHFCCKQEILPNMWECLTKTKSTGHMHTHKHAHNVLRVLTKSAVFAHLVCHTQQRAWYQSADEADCWTEICHLLGTSQSRDRKHRWQYAFVSQPLTSFISVSAKLERVLLKTQNEL